MAAKVFSTTLIVLAGLGNLVPASLPSVTLLDRFSGRSEATG